MKPDEQAAILKRSLTARKANHRGKAFQGRLESIFLGYEKGGHATIRKVDPPVKVFGTGKQRSVVFIDNPWLDFHGTWTDQGGRAIAIEAKATDGDRLAMGTGGVTQDQLDSIWRWHSAGAITAVAWERGPEIRILTGPEIIDAWNAGAKSIQWRHASPVPRGIGWVEFDILAVLADRIV